MSNVALQIASFINELRNLSLSQKEGISNMINLIDNEEEESCSFSEGVALGAFVSWGILTIEEDICYTIKSLSKTLAPIGMEEKISALRENPIFKPQAESQDLRPELLKAQEIINKRILTLEEIQKSLLDISEEDMENSFSPEVISNFQNNWNKELRQLVDNV